MWYSDELGGFPFEGLVVIYLDSIIYFKGCLLLEAYFDWHVLDYDYWRLAFENLHGTKD